MEANEINDNIKLNSINEISKSICKIIIGDSNSTGFFLKIQYDLNPKYMLVTAHHVIPYPLVEDNKTIEIITDIDNKKQEIILDSIKRKIYCLKNHDITAIQILNEDNLLNKVKFLVFDKNCETIQYKKNLNIEAFIFHHPNNNELKFNRGRIIKVKYPKEFEFEHNLSTNAGSSGSPILIFEKPNEEPKVIGVHTSAIEGENNNVGTFINVLIEAIIDKKFYKNHLYIGINKNSTLYFKPI